MANNVVDQARDCCSGCGLCVQVCPKSCLGMEPDCEGFLFPQIDLSACIDCGICLRNCPMLHVEGVLHKGRAKAFAAALKDREVLQESTSGGVFSAMAGQILSRGGVVYGAVLGEDLQVRHQAARTPEEMARMRGSKYVQSDINDIYKPIKEDLRQGKEVLFTGTPCQVAAVAHWTKDCCHTLTTIDLVCHGVPSPGLFSQHIQWLGRKLASPVVYLDFRSKAKGYWGLFKERINTKASYVDKLAVSDPYYAAFLRCETFREACYRCPFSCASRVSDITICDYWGVEVEHPSFNAKNGTSAVIVNTDRGSNLFSEAAHQLNILESSIEQVSKHQQNLNAPSPRPLARNHVYQDIATVGYAAWAKKYELSLARYIAVLRSLMPRWIKVLKRRVFS